MLHMDIIRERLSREHNIETIFTIPNVVYLMKMKQLNHEKIKTGTNVLELVTSGYFVHIISDFTGKLSEEDKENIEYKNDHELSEIYKDKLHRRLLVRSGTDMPEQGTIETIYEPYAEVEIV